MFYVIGGQRYKCPNCPKVYKHYQTKRRHLLYECGKEPSFVCPVVDCSYRGKRKAHLVSHLYNIHYNMVTNVPKNDPKHEIYDDY